MHIPKTENSSDAQDHARFHESPGKKEQLRTANHECKHSTSLFGLERFAIMQGCTCSEELALMGTVGSHPLDSIELFAVKVACQAKQQ